MSGSKIDKSLLASAKSIAKNKRYYNKQVQDKNGNVINNGALRRREQRAAKKAREANIFDDSVEQMQKLAKKQRNQPDGVQAFLFFVNTVQATREDQDSSSSEVVIKRL